MTCKSEEIKRLKLKLQLYGSYTREIEQKEHRYFKIEQELNANDNIHNSAKNLGIKSDDPHHTAEEKLQLEYASIDQEMEDIKVERSYLGLDEFIGSLTPIEFKILHNVYTTQMTHQGAAIDANMSRRSVQRKLNEIYESWRSSPHKTMI